MWVSSLTRKTKRISLLYLVFSLVVLTFVAGSLSNLQLHPGTPFPGAGDTDLTGQSAKIQPTFHDHGQTSPLRCLQGIFAIVFIVLMFYVPIRLLFLLNTRKTLWLILAMGIALMLAYMVSWIAPEQTAYTPVEILELPISTTFDYQVTPLGNPPQILVRLVLLGILMGMALLAFKIVKGRRDLKEPEDLLLHEMEQAVHALKVGMDLKNVIVRCYMQMTHLLQKERGIDRAHDMTVREFEDLLSAQGFPSGPVHQLTSLFELTRYGMYPVGALEEECALKNLNAIIQHCRRVED